MTVIIERVQNGWLLILPEGDDPDLEERQFVFEDCETHNAPSSESLKHLLWEAFGDYFQSKWQGGLTIKNTSNGREQTNDDWQGEDDDILCSD